MKLKNFIAYWIPVIVYSGLIFVLSSRALPPHPIIISMSQRVLHALEFFFLSVLLFRAFNNSSFKQYAYPLAIILTGIYGFLDEIHQAFVFGRVSDLGDALADTFGGCVILFNALIPKDFKMVFYSLDGK